MRVLILGAGGHAQVIADILLRMQEADPGIVIVGYLDDNPSLAGEHLLGLPVLGEIAQLTGIPHDAVVVAVGDNATRQRLFKKWGNEGEHFATACHPRAIIAPDVQVGPGSMICAGVIVNPGSVVGTNVILNTGCTVDHHNRIGDHVHIAPGVHLGGGVSIGEGTLVGIGATVMPQRRVGDWSVVSAGALVHSDLGDKVVAAGVPARVIRNIAGEG
jgi:sugar O-acyltransferase (sialic acid O-acetyltransferase NeuD family)